MILVKIGSEISRKCVLESVISPILFTIMKNDIFANIQPGIGRSLFAGDGGS